jgi:hypothetical protein
MMQHASHHRFLPLFALFTAFIVLGSVAAHADDPTPDLKAITDTVDTLCGTVKDDLTVSINSLLNRLYDVKISGADNLISNTQQQLVTALKHAQYCKVQMFNVLLDILSTAKSFNETRPRRDPQKAQTSQFDGTYAFVSSMKMNEAYMTMRTEHLLPCPNRQVPSSLIIFNGQARLLAFGGTVGPSGELEMRRDPEPLGRAAGAFPGIEVIMDGRIDGKGIVRVRQVGNNCGYDLIWQKVSK